MLTRSSFALITALILASASNAFAARAHNNGYDVGNGAFSPPNWNEERWFDQAKGTLG
jgi:hypothetical protein